jgi:hypothetical protein
MSEISAARSRGAASILLLLTAAVWAAACGDPASTPFSPSATSTGQSGASALPVQPGTYVLGASASITPVANGQTVVFEGCSGTGTFVGVSILSFMTLGREGTMWVAKSATPADGDAEIRLADVQGPAGLVVIAGSARGTALDRRAVGAIGLASITFSGEGVPTATLSGSASLSPSAAFTGTGLGLFTVNSPIGTGSCSQAVWSLRKPEPCELTNTCP